MGGFNNRSTDEAYKNKAISDAKNDTDELTFPINSKNSDQAVFAAKIRELEYKKEMDKLKSSSDMDYYTDLLRS